MAGELPANLASLDPYLPPQSPARTSAAATAASAGSGQNETEIETDRARGRLPWVTLTFATSLDAMLSLAPGQRTALSGDESKAMTHYLRSRHRAVCIGVNTAVADDPGLNCRHPYPGPAGASSSSSSCQPRPIVIDPNCRWRPARDAKMLRLARLRQGRAPLVVVRAEPPPEQRALLEEHGGRYVVVGGGSGGEGSDEGDGGGGGDLSWRDILAAVVEADPSLDSIMIEGGGHVINSLLSTANRSLVDSVIVTIAPRWLGRGGVVVSPVRETGDDGTLLLPQLRGVLWQQFGDDAVLSGKLA